MKAIVCVKQVPDTSGKVSVKPDGTLDRASMATITNPDDLNALEAALKLKDATGCEVVVVTMGPPPAEGMLRELLARGADKAVLVSGREFGGSDTFATSQILAAAVNKIGVGPEDVVFCGRQAIDGDTAQVGPQIAEKLHLPQVTYVTEIKKDGNALTVFNTFGAERDDVVITDMPATDHFSIVDADGNVMPWQKSADGRLVFFAKGVPAKGYKTFRIVHGGESGENTVKVENKTIENKFFTVKFDKDMNIASLIHKATGRAVAPEGEVLNKIYAYDDRPFNHEAWDIKAYFDQKYTEINDVSAVDVTESGPVRTVIKVTRKFLSSTIEQSFIFYADLPRIDVDYTVDWKEKKILLKADFPVDVNATEATYDIQFGNYKRPTHRNTLWDFAQFEVVGHKWVDLSDNSFGLSVLNDCKYGHDIKDGHIRTSLLRCAVNPNSEQDREVHRFTYSIYPHAGSVDTSDVVNQGYSHNLPLYCVSGKAAHDSYSLVSTDKDNVIIETVKKAEDSDDVVIRAYETWNKTTDCVYTFDRAPKSVYVCNLLEENEEQLEVSGNTVSLRFKPFEIKTVKVTF